MKRKGRQILALVLMLAMCLGCMPMHVLAVEAESDSAEAESAIVEETLDSEEVEENAATEMAEESMAAVEEGKMAESQQQETEQKEESEDGVPTLLNEEASEQNPEGEKVQFAGGDGTEANPYQVATAEQLDAVRNDLTAYYVQMASIDLGEYDNWIPIGDGSAPFTGEYNGNGFSIKNLTITNVDLVERDGSLGYYVGLFGYVDNNGLIRNVTLKDANINLSFSDSGSYSYYMGAVAGWGSHITDCEADGTLVVTETSSSCFLGYVGGITGYGDAKNSINYIDITVNSTYTGGYTIYAGGVAGYAFFKAMTNNINYGDVDVTAPANALCGGICGEGDADTCVNYGNVTCKVTQYYGWNSAHDNADAGGIVGYSDDAIKNCINYGNVNARKEQEKSGCGAGGIAGHIGYYSSGLLQNCYNFAECIDSDGGAGRISSNTGSNGTTSYTVSNYSLNTTLVNGAEVTDDVGLDTRNGESMSADEMNAAIKSILISLGLETAEGSDDYFVLIHDNNAYQNSASDFFDADEKTNFSTIYWQEALSNAGVVEKGGIIVNLLGKSWDGACFGVVMSMIYAQLTNVFNGQSYYSLGKPKNNYLNFP